jgi:hypothetical protein
MRYHVVMKNVRADDAQAMLEEIGDIVHSHVVCLLELRKEQQSVVRQATHDIESIEVEQMKQRIVS